MQNDTLIHIDPEILTTQFACDLGVCKGACCTFPGGSGAPILNEEMDYLRAAFVLLRERLPIEHVKTAEEFGLFEIDGENRSIQCYNDRACIFVEWENGIAKCAVQNAYYRGETAFMKPKSCHLFPIRQSGKMSPAIRLEKFSECEPALERGRISGTSLVDFLQEPITRIFGDEFYLIISKMAGKAQKRS